MINAGKFWASNDKTYSWKKLNLQRYSTCFHYNISSIVPIYCRQPLHMFQCFLYNRRRPYLETYLKPFRFKYYVFKFI